MLRVLAAVHRGDFSVRMPGGVAGDAGKLAAALNDLIESNQRLEREIRRISHHVGKDGQVKRATVAQTGGGPGATLDAGNRPLADPARPNTAIPPGSSA